MNGTEMIGFALLDGNRTLLIELPVSVFEALVAEGEKQCREGSLLDLNGNTVGKWVLKDEEYELHVNPRNLQE